jgi:hypothetical protein
MCACPLHSKIETHTTFSLQSKFLKKLATMKMHFVAVDVEP